jgi:G:T-mismatch repair DNA endonuclease (very short patch repair protein)
MELQAATRAVLATRIEQSRTDADVSLADLSTRTGIEFNELEAKLTGNDDFTLPELATISTCVGAKFSDWLSNLEPVAA